MTRVAIGAIMKQEEPYVLEWVAYHKALGFDLIIADNGGTDNTTKILTALDTAGIITRIDFRFCIKTPQIPAYRAIMRVARRLKIDIIGLLDCDEFFARNVPINALNPDEGARHIAMEFQNFDASQISYYWLIYGSRTEQRDINLPVLERFSYHAKIDESLNKKAKSFKSFVNVKDMFRFSNILFLGPQIMSPHIFDGATKKWIIDDKQVDPITYNQHQRNVTHNNGLILHYIIKSREEFGVKKSRGSATHDLSKYNNDYFSKFDLNDIYDPIGAEVIAKLHYDIDELRKIVSSYYKPDENLSFLSIFKLRLLAFGVSKFEHRKKYLKFQRYLLRQNYFIANRLAKLFDHKPKP